MYMTENKYSHVSIPKKVEIACELLLKEDRDLFTYEVNERTLTQNLAKHLQKFFPNFSVDCEYNRDGNDPKEIPQNDPENPTKKVIPDIIIHKRGCNAHNLVVIEAKKDANDCDMRNDCVKLLGICETLKYHHAFFINFICNPKSPQIDVYNVDKTELIFSIPYDPNS